MRLRWLMMTFPPVEASTVDARSSWRAYPPEHPSPPEIVLSWRGKEATEACNTKTKGRPYPPYADELLAKYRIGTLAKAP